MNINLLPKIANNSITKIDKTIHSVFLKSQYRYKYLLLKKQYNIVREYCGYFTIEFSIDLKVF